MKIHMIEARDLPDLWFRAVNDLLDVGKRFKVDRGSFAGQTRLEYDYFIGHIKYPGHGSGTPEILPDIPAHLGIPNPVEFEYVYGGGEYERSYVEYVMTPRVMPGESYTYGQRLSEFEIEDPNLPWAYGDDLRKEIFIQDEEIWNDPKIVICRSDRSDEDSKVRGGPAINQIELAIWIYKNKGHRNNQMVLQVAKPDDMLLQDPPCLRSIDTRIQSNEEKEKVKLLALLRKYGMIPDLSLSPSCETLKDMFRYVCKEQKQTFDVEDTLKECEVPELSFVVYFRSWDLWAGLPCNLAGLQALKEYMAAEIGVEDGDMIVESKGLHLYGYSIDIAKMRCMKETITADGGMCA